MECSFCLLGRKNDVGSISKFLRDSPPGAARKLARPLPLQGRMKCARLAAKPPCA
jgi:hypothetical protein